jgi:hypothetical protein
MPLQPRLGRDDARFVASRRMSARSTLRTAQMRKSVSRVGFRSSRSVKLIMARDKPARSASSVMERPRCSRVSRNNLATAAHVPSRSLDSDTGFEYLKKCLTMDVTIVTSRHV